MQTMMIKAPWVMKPSGRTEATVYGVGTSDMGPSRRRVDGKQQRHPAYLAWMNMLKRAYCPKHHERQPTYEGVSVGAEWLTLSSFYDWWATHAVEGWQLDKDLIAPDARCYGPDTCIYVPPALNSLLVNSGAARGELPQGVSWDKRRRCYQAHLTVEGANRHLGRFDNLPDACAAYEEAKRAYVEDVLEKYRESINRYDEVAAGVYLTLDRQLQDMWQHCSRVETETHKEVA